ncbi:PE-PGRS family protein, partial [Mycobacterium tuberculosis GM 1503]
MSWVMVSPELVVAAAADLAGIGSAISSANAAAAVNTTGLLTAGADEVSTAICGVCSVPKARPTRRRAHRRRRFTPVRAGPERRRSAYATAEPPPCRRCWPRS